MKILEQKAIVQYLGHPSTPNILQFYFLFYSTSLARKQLNPRPLYKLTKQNSGLIDGVMMPFRQKTNICGHFITRKHAWKYKTHESH